LSGGTSAWPADVLAALKNFAQGDIIEKVPFSYFGATANGLPLNFPPTEAELKSLEKQQEDGIREFAFIGWEPSSEQEVFAVITSQTCDVAEQGLPSQPWVQVSPLYSLSADYAGKTLPDFLYPVQPPGFPKGVWAIDLRLEVPIEKTVLVGKKPRPAFAIESEAIAFADRLGLRRDRAALSAKITDTVGSTLRQKRRKRDRFRKTLRKEVYEVCLHIDGTRASPTAVCLHVITNGPVSDRVREEFDKWWDEASPGCAAADLKLWPNEYHDRNHTDLMEHTKWIPLDLG
jgi:hypothetical protein